MTKPLPARPDLDHLRKQAKKLLARAQAGDADALAALRPAFPGLGDGQPDAAALASLRLADAQFALARNTGFANWPRLARHVDQLRALEGAWEFLELEIDGQRLPAAAFATARVLIDGDRFRSETIEAVYEGEFNIDVETEPHGIDIHFVAGPEAGNVNYGVFALAGDCLRICLNLTGGARPAEFRTHPGAGLAFETLRRTSPARPPGVTGGAAATAPPAASPAPPPARFEYAASATLARLQGAWTAVELVRDGQALPAFLCATGRRTNAGHETKVWFGGQLMVHALLRIDEGAAPLNVDYCNLSGPAAGAVQLGLLQWAGEEAVFCMAAPGQARPTDFTSAAGSGRTLSRWRRAPN